MNRLPRILFVLNPSIGRNSCWVRARIFKDIFLDNGWHVEYVDWTPDSSQNILAKSSRLNNKIVRLARNFDVVYLIKVPSLYFVRRLKASCHAKVVFDLNDALWNSHHQYQWKSLVEILQNVDAVFAENEYLASYARKYHHTVRVVPDSAPLERFDAMRSIREKQPNDKTVIGWVGSPSTLGALAAIQQPLERVFERYANLELRIVGCSNVSMLPQFKHVNYSIIPDGYDEKILIREILNLDIGLFPPPSDIDDYCARGALKAVLYMAGGVPCVCQAAGDCAVLIQDGSNGMLATSQEEWIEKIEVLVDSPQLRVEMGRRGLELVRNQRALLPVFSQLKDALRDVMSLQHRTTFSRVTMGAQVKCVECKQMIEYVIKRLATVCRKRTYTWKCRQ